MTQTISQWIDANSELTDVAASMAWGAIKGHHQARDTSPRHTPSDIVGLVEEAGYALRDTASDDRAAFLAAEALRLAGYAVTFGTIGHDDCILAAI